MSKKNFDDLIDSSTHTNGDAAAIKNIISNTEPAKTTEQPAGINVEHVAANIVKLQLLTSKDVERITGLSSRTTAKYLREGKIKAVKHGTAWAINPDDLNEYLAGRYDYEWIAKCKQTEAERKARRKPRERKVKAEPEA